MFENLDVYKKAVSFAVEINRLCRNIRHLEIKDQIQRASLSVPLNIAEGSGRNTPKEKIQFYKMARGSLFECIPLLEISFKLDHINDAQHECLYRMAEDIGKMVNGLINSLKNQ
jgi:four helix bundle protein